MKIALAVTLLLITAQIPSCQPGSTEIVGYVDDKYLLPGPSGAPQPVIIIGATEHQVPWDFYREVRIGDLVKFEKGRWIILKKVPR